MPFPGYLGGNRSYVLLILKLMPGKINKSFYFGGTWSCPILIQWVGHYQFSFYKRRWFRAALIIWILGKTTFTAVRVTVFLGLWAELRVLFLSLKLQIISVYFFFWSIASFAFLCATADISRSTQDEPFNSGEKSACTLHSLLSSALHSLAQQTSMTGTSCQAPTFLWVLVRDKIKVWVQKLWYCNIQQKN